MSSREKNLLSIVYTYNGAAIEIIDSINLDAMKSLESRGLVKVSASDGYIYATPTKEPKTLDWEKETQAP